MGFGVICYLFVMLQTPAHELTTCLLCCKSCGLLLPAGKAWWLLQQQATAEMMACGRMAPLPLSLTAFLLAAQTTPTAWGQHWSLTPTLE
jgi:hypothetical protein